jgi:tRNA G18 (ribose-2'-O)-methylase SpoU
MRENNRNDKRNFERRDGKKRDFKGKRDYRDRDRKQEVQQADEEFTGGMVEGRNAVIEAFRSGKTVDKLFVLASSQDGPIRTIIRDFDIVGLNDLETALRDRRGRSVMITFDDGYLDFCLLVLNLRMN